MIPESIRWNIGVIALCINGEFGDIEPDEIPPRKGQMLTVKDLDTCLGCGKLYLSFDGEWFYDARQFVPICPPLNEVDKILKADVNNDFIDA